MKFFLNPNTIPSFNLALEEFLFKGKEDYFLLWRNEPCVVAGKHQNLLAEIDHSYVLKNKIPVHRRISGGGTVYHDLGNINFSVILTRPQEKLVDFQKYMTPIFEALQSFGLEVQFSERNDIYLKEKKISGNAEHAVRNRVLHHGTLLFDANLEHLRNSIADNRSRFKGRSVASVPASVGNIKPHLKSSMSTEDFMLQLGELLLQSLPAQKITVLNQQELSAINDLGISKYQTDKWNIGYGPKYEYAGQAIVNGEKIQLDLSVHQGLISKIEFNGNWPEVLRDKISFQLINQYHFPKNISEVLKKNNFNESETNLIMSLCFEL